MGKTLWLLGTLTLGACLPASLMSSRDPADPERSPATDENTTTDKLPSIPIALQLPDLWEAHEIAQIEILNQRGEDPLGIDPNTRNFDNFKNRRMCALGSAPGECDAGGPLPDFVTNGTFYDGQGYVMGLTMRRGLVDRFIPTGTKYYSRGIFVQHEDGTFEICYGEWNGAPMDAEELARRCSSNGSRPREALGGGGLLLYRGQRACSETSIAAPCYDDVDLASVQRFDNGGAGINAGQFRKTQHLVAGIREGRAYLAWPRDGSGGRSGRQIQSDFLAAGFSDAVKFDGSSGFFARGNLTAGTGSNTTGILVRTATAP